MKNLKIREDFLPYCLPDISDKEIDSMLGTLKSGWLAKGPKTLEFQHKFAESVGAKYAIGLNSCTAALFLALKCYNIGPGDEVIVPAMTFSASANTILHCGATPVFADIDPETGCIDTESIKSKITSRTKAIVPVHYSGLPCDLDTIYEIADEHGLIVSEDAAHAVRTFYKGRAIGNKVRNTASFSFYATKNLATGEGGMLVTDDEAVYNRAIMLASHGMDANAWKRYGKGGSWQYDIIEPGYKYNMFDLQAALGLIQLSRMDEMQAKRFELVSIYDSAFKQLPQIKLQYEPDYAGHSKHLYIIRINSDMLTIDRNAFIEELNRYNIGTSVHFIPLHMMTAYKKYRDVRLPNTMEWYESIISLPLYSKLSTEDAEYVAEVVTKIVEEHKK